jgi:hypothetical protein
LLDWKPRTSLRSGLQRTVAYFDGLLADRNDITREVTAA